MALCLINGVTLRNLPYGSHKNVYGATMMYGKLDKSFDMRVLSYKTNNKDHTTNNAAAKQFNVAIATKLDKFLVF